MLRAWQCESPFRGVLSRQNVAPARRVADAPTLDAVSTRPEVDAIRSCSYLANLAVTVTSNSFSLAAAWNPSISRRRSGLWRISATCIGLHATRRLWSGRIPRPPEIQCHFISDPLSSAHHIGSLTAVRSYISSSLDLSKIISCRVSPTMSYTLVSSIAPTGHASSHMPQ